MTKHLLFLIITHLCFRICSIAQPGALDQSFGREGKVLMDLNHTNNVATKILIQTDGKTVVVGYSTPNQGEQYFSIARFKTDGSIDETFGDNGFVETHFHYNYAGAQSAVLQPDGKIIVAGYLFNGYTLDFVLVRYTSSGLRDYTFGESGMVSTDFTDFHDSYDKANEIVLQSDGKIVVCGNKYDLNNLEMDATLARYDQDGVLDDSFGVNGKIAINVGKFGLWQSFSSVAMQSDGKIVAGGFTECHDEINDIYSDAFIVARFTPNGTLDNDFGNGGIAQTLIGTKAAGTAIAVQSNGKVLLTGSAKMTNGGYDELVIARYNVDGILDTNFGNNGIVMTSFDNTDDVGNDIVIQSDQKILVAGFTAVANGTTLDFSLARFNPNGTLDNSFGSGGKVITDFDSNWDFGMSIALQKNGKIVVTGYAKMENDYNFALARFLNDEALPIKLESFYVKKNRESVQLLWQTALEKNSSYFEIQRSDNGKDWLAIGSQTASMYSDSLRGYEFVDHSPLNNNLYRLKMIDADGTYAFSSVKTIVYETDLSDQKVNVFPNPAVSKIIIEAQDMFSIESMLIVDSNGRTIPVKQNNRNELDIRQFQPGLYHLVINFIYGKSESRKFLVE